jgi:hypothetical protein
VVGFEPDTNPVTEKKNPSKSRHQNFKRKDGNRNYKGKSNRRNKRS